MKQKAILTALLFLFIMTIISSCDINDIESDTTISEVSGQLIYKFEYITYNSNSIDNIRQYNSYMVSNSWNNDLLIPYKNSILIFDTDEATAIQLQTENDDFYFHSSIIFQMVPL